MLKIPSVIYQKNILTCNKYDIQPLDFVLTNNELVL